MNSTTNESAAPRIAAMSAGSWLFDIPGCTIENRKAAPQFLSPLSQAGQLPGRSFFKARLPTSQGIRTLALLKVFEKPNWVACPAD